jgi:hypothetical protein
MDALERLHEEIGQMSPLEAGLTFCIDYITRLEQGDFEYTDSGYIYRPNFVALALHYQRAFNATFTLRGNPEEFYKFPHLELTKAQNGYSRCRVEQIIQFDALLFYIRQANDFFHKGASRIQNPKPLISP